MNKSKKTTPTMTLSPERIRAALALPRFDAALAHNAMSPSPRPLTRPTGRPGTARIGAVLLVLFEKFNAPHIVLIRRHDDLKNHPGQIAFPGGGQEPGEQLLETALRETQEEIGLKKYCVEVLGGLEPVYISPSDFIVYPFVAWHQGQPAFTKNTNEVSEIIEAPLGLLLDPSMGCTEIRIMNNTELTVPFYRLGNDTVWGATAMILSELVARFKSAHSFA